MKKIVSRSLLAGAFALAVAVPGWAAGQGNATEVKPEKVAAMSQNLDQVKHVQEALKEKGSYHGAIDGHMGKKTRTAIRAFQKSNHLKVTGKMDQQTAEKLGVELASAPKAGENMMKSDQPEVTKK